MVHNTGENAENEATSPAHRIVGRHVDSGLFVLERGYAPGHRMPVHQHKGAVLYFVVGGSITEAHRKTSRLLEPTSLCFLPPGEPHANEFHRAARLFEIYLEGPWLERIQAHAATPLAPCHLREQDVLVRLAAQLRQEFRKADTASLLAMEGLTLEVVAQICRSQQAAETGLRAPRWLGEVIDMLHARSEEGLSLTEIAGTVGVHPAHLARVFRRHCRCSVGDYLRGLRIERARHQLLSTDFPLAEIALMAGYSDQSHFSHAFKRHTGMTPGEFRRASGTVQIAPSCKTRDKMQS